MELIQIETEWIKLEQFLKLISVAYSGGMAKNIIQDGLVKVNGEIEYRRGKKLHPGDVVLFDEKEYVIRGSM